MLRSAPISPAVSGARIPAASAAHSARSISWKTEEVSLTGPSLFRVRAGPRRRIATMCGIIAYVGPRDSVGLLMSGLKRLEYRGYDSAGIAVLDRAGHLETRKHAGKLKVLADDLAEHPLGATAARESATPAGRPTEARPTGTPTRSSRRTAGSRSSTTASSRTSPS